MISDNPQSEGRMFTKSSLKLVATCMATFFCSVAVNASALADGGAGKSQIQKTQPLKLEKPAIDRVQIKTNDDGGYVIGDPDAPVIITEFASYTCGHCANFEVNDAPKLKSEYVDTGKARFEIRSLTLNPIDKTVAMLARCGADEDFFNRHSFWLKSQKQWLSKAGQLSEPTQKLAGVGNSSLLMLALYNDLGLSAYSAQIGLSDEQARKCLKDGETSRILDDMRADTLVNLGINGTPSFLVNGKVAAGVHTYDQLTAYLKNN